MNAISFSREKTQILKGIALLLMLVHHTCTPSYSEGGTVKARYRIGLKARNAFLCHF